MAFKLQLVNASFLTLDVYPLSQKNDPPLLKKLGAFESITLETPRGRKWVAQDRHSGVEIARIAPDPDETRVVISTREIRPARSDTPVTVSFENQTRYPVILYEVDSKGNELERARLFPGDKNLQRTFATHPWRFRAVSLGTEVGFFIPDGGPHQQYAARYSPPSAGQASSIEWLNATPLNLHVKWIDENGDEQVYDTLEAYGTLQASTYPGHAWLVRDIESGALVMTAVGSNTPQTIRIGTEAVKDLPGGSPVHLEMKNSLQFAVEVYQIDEHGSATQAGSLRPGESLSLDTASGRPWRILQKNSGTEVGFLIPNRKAEQVYDLRLRSSDSSTPVSVEFENRSPLNLQLYWCDFEGQEKPFASMPAGGSVVQKTFATHPWVLRDQYSGVAVGALVATSRPEKLTFTGQGLQSMGGVKPVDVLFHNSIPLPVRLVWIDYEGNEQPYTTLEPGATFGQATFAGHPWRGYVEGIAEPVGVFIPSGEPQQEVEFCLETFEGQPSAQIQFLNDTPLTLNVYWVDRQGQERLFRTLAPIDACTQSTFVGHSWVVRDAYSGVLLSTKVAAPGQETVTISGSSITAQPGSENWNITLTNGTPFTARLFQVEADGKESFVGLLKPGEWTERNTPAGVPWRLRTQHAGDELGLFIPRAEQNQVHVFQLRSANSRTPARVQFTNRTMLTAQIFWIDYDGAEKLMKDLPPGASAQFKTYLTHPWIVRDQGSGQVIDYAFGRLEDQQIELTHEDILPQSSDVQVQITFLNNLPFSVDLFYLGSDGMEKYYKSLDPGGGYVQSSYATHPWLVRPRQSDQIVAVYLTRSDPFQNVEINARSVDGDLKTGIRFVNLTPLAVGVYWIDYQGAEQKMFDLRPREAAPVETYATHPWVVRDLHSGEAVAFTVATREPQILEINDLGMRSLMGENRIQLSFVNPFNFSVSVFWADYDGNETYQGEIPPGGTWPVETYASHPWRFRALDNNDLLDLLIVGRQNDPQYILKNNWVRTTERPDGKLWTGEVALYEGPHFQGRVWILHGNLPRFSSIEGLNDRVMSLKVGPNTSATLFLDDQFQGENDVFYLDNPDLRTSDVGNRRSSSLLINRVVPVEATGISSTTTLSKDFSPAGGQRSAEAVPLYRTIVSFPPGVKMVNVWATERLTLESQGQEYTIDPVSPAYLKVNPLGKLMLRIRPEKLGVPVLMLRTDRMEVDQRFLVFPDAAVHRKIANMEEGTLWRHSQELGLDTSRFGENDCAQIQSAIQNISRTVPVATRTAAHGGLKDRLVNADAMEYPAWSLDLGGGGAAYRPVGAAELKQANENARLITADGMLAQGILDDLVKFGETLDQVIIQPAERTLTPVFKEGLEALDKFGKTVESGFKQAEEQAGRTLTDVWDRTVEWGSETVQEAGKFFGDTAAAVEEALNEFGSQLAEFSANVLSATLKFGNTVLRFAIDTVEKAGQLINYLIDQAGIAWQKFVDFMEKLFDFDWSDVIRAHDYLIGVINGAFEFFEGVFDNLEQQGAHMLDGIEGEMVQAIDRQIASLGVSGAQPPVQAPKIDLTEAFEKVNWLLSTVFDVSGYLTQGLASTAVSLATDAASSGPVENKLDQINLKLPLGDEQAEKLLGQFIGSIYTFKAAVEDPARARDLILGGVLNLLKTAAQTGLELLKSVIQTLLELIKATIGMIAKALNKPIDIPFISDFYAQISGRELSAVSLACLLLAIPLTVISKLATGETAFQAATAMAQDANADRENRLKRDWGIANASMHFILMQLSPITTAIGALIPEGSSTGTVAFSIWGLLPVSFGLISQLAGSPTGYPKTNDAGLIQTRSALYYDQENWDLAPDYWSSVIWHFQWVNFVLGVLGSGLGAGLGKSKVAAQAGTVMDYAVPVINTTVGITALGLTSKLADTERAKIREAARLLNSLGEASTQKQVLDMVITREIYGEQQDQDLGSLDIAGQVNARRDALDEGQRAGKLADGESMLWGIIGVDPGAADRFTQASQRARLPESVEPYMRRMSSSLLDPFPGIFGFATIKQLNESTYFIPLGIQVAIDFLSHATIGGITLARTLMGEF